MTYEFGLFLAKFGVNGMRNEFALLKYCMVIDFDLSITLDT